MIPMSLAEIAAATGGKLSETADPEAIVTGGIEYDSRKAGPGGLFLALPGRRSTGTTSPRPPATGARSPSSPAVK
ncbi:hypothetical protein GCM10029992_59030 [Glycomyces albus]